MPIRSSVPAQASVKIEAKATFTLIELLVVVAIISVLAAMLLPSLSVAREKSKRSVCFGNLKQIYMGAMSYNDDFDNEVPMHFDAGAVDGSLATEDSIYGTNVAAYTG